MPAQSASNNSADVYEDQTPNLIGDLTLLTANSFSFLSLYFDSDIFISFFALPSPFVCPKTKKQSNSFSKINIITNKIN